MKLNGVMVLAWLLEAAIEIVVGIVIALFLRRFVCLLAIVKGNSMLETLHSGDILFAFRPRLCGGPKRFDVVLCRYPNRRGLFVKRVVALPGESVAVECGVLKIGGIPVDEPASIRPARRDMVERRIGRGEYFVMGDNRPSSRDSRSVGPIPEDGIIAVARCVIFPPKRIRKL